MKKNILELISALRFRKLLVVFSCLLLSSNISFAQCDGNGDIVQDTATFVSNMSHQLVGQSFMPTCTGYLSTITVWVYNPSTTRELTLALYDDYPGGNTIASETTTVQSGTGLVEAIFTFDPNTALTTSGEFLYFLIGGGSSYYSYALSSIFDQTNPVEGNYYYYDENFAFEDYSPWDMRFSVLFEDSVPPIARCQDFTAFLDSTTGDVYLNWVDIDNGSSDADSGVALRSLSDEYFDCDDIGTTQTVTLYVVDNAGNGDSCDATVWIVDSSSPSVDSCPSNITVSLPSGGCSAIVNYTTPQFSDNCELESVILYEGLASGSEFPPGETSVVYRAFDIYGNGAQCSFTVTVGDDEESPVIICPENISVMNDYNECNAVVNYTINYTDNCTAVQDLLFDQTEGLSSGSTFSIGTTTNTFIVTDSKGNSSTCSFDITVTDSQYPIINCPEDIIVSSEPDTCEAIVIYNAPTYSDNCSVASITQIAGQLSGTTFSVGTVTNTFLVEDTNGNQTTCSFNVIVKDVTPPIAVCQNFTAQLDANGSVTVSSGDIDNSSSDLCSSVTLHLGAIAFSGETTTSSITDELIPGSNFYVNAYSFVAPSDGDFDFVFNGISSNSGLITAVVWNAPPVRNSGRFNERPEYLGLISRNEDGSFASGDVSYSLIEGNTYYFDMFTPTPGETVTYQGGVIHDGDAVYTCDDVGDNSLDLFVIDTSGNVSSCTSTITVVDNENPVVVCQDITIQLDEFGETSFEVADVVLSTSDNCGVNTVTIDIDTFDCGDVGPNNVTVTVTDVNGNFSTCIAVVTVEDIIPPASDCQDITIQLDAFGTATITPADVDGGSTGDNCYLDQDDVTINIDTFDCSNIGPNNVTVTYTDINDNYTTCIAVVTVEDVTPPIAFCQDFTAQLDANGSVTVSSGDIDNGSTDQCNSVTLHLGALAFGGETTTSSPTDELIPGLIFYINEYSFVAPRDGIYEFVFNGTTSNSGPIAAIVWDAPPQRNNGDYYLRSEYLGATSRNEDGSFASGDVSYSLIEGNTYYFDMVALTAEETAAYQGGVIHDGDAVFTCADIGANSMELLVIDTSGNVSSCSSTITVVDNENPVVVCQDITIQLDEFGDASIVVNDVVSSTSDNCG
ncbi:MAG: HYR domain-containing protein, partial [Maribacter sp.]|nr:HYR domain-containing protein [Maribacter sp.]